MHSSHATLPPRVAVIKCGVGNLLSVRNALGRLGMDAYEAACVKDLRQAQAIILPGVGAFPAAMAHLRQEDWLGPLAEHVLEKRKPFLGICLGMQLLAESSAEFGWTEGLGWIAGQVTRLSDDGVRLPHVGWNTVEDRDPMLFARVPDDAHFYFDHSFHFESASDAKAGSCRYGQVFVAAVRRDNLWGTQFHPEKSQIYGLMLLRNFCNTIERRPAC